MATKGSHTVDEIKLALNTLGLSEDDELTAEMVARQYVRLAISASKDKERKAELEQASKTLG